MNKPKHKFKSGQMVKIIATNEQLEDIEIDSHEAKIIPIKAIDGWGGFGKKIKSNIPSYIIEGGWTIPETFLEAI